MERSATPVVGAAISATLPVNPTPPDIATSQVEVRILIVDDNERNLIALEASLAGIDASIDKAMSGEDALRSLLEREYAVILLDVQMPGMDGFETGRVIRERERSQHTPIIYLTAHDKDYQNAFTGYEVGAVDYIAKPYDPNILLAKISTFVELFRNREEVRRQSELVVRINRELEEQNHRIENLNLQVSAMNEELEDRVRRRTEQLEEANLKLQTEVAERLKAEMEVRLLNSSLERRVQERTSDLEAFSYSLSHDLRAPLRSIDGFSSVLSEMVEDRLTPEESGYFVRIRNACSRMQHLIDDMLLLARVTHGRMDVQSVDLSAIVREIHDDLRHNYPDHKVEFTLHSELKVNGDPGLLRIALFNLLDNAWKFTLHEEHPSVSVSCRLDEEEREWIEVRDNGTGFDPRRSEELFTPFRRLHSAEEFSGTGIGLTIVQRVVARHSGEIGVDSKPGEGTVVRFRVGESIEL